MIQVRPARAETNLYSLQIGVMEWSYVLHRDYQTHSMTCEHDPDKI